MANTPPITPFDLDQESLDSLEELLKSSNGPTDRIHTGKLIKARFLSANGHDLYFDIGEKEEGICSSEDFKTLPNVGEELKLLVLKREAEGPALLSKKKADRLLLWQNIKEAHQSSSNLSAKIARIMPMGYLVDYEGLELFMPLSQSALSPASSRGHSLGKEIDFRVIELKERYYSAIISHRVVVTERNEALWDQFEQNHKVGDLVEGLVVKKVSFGIFLEVEGLIALLHLNDISWKKGASFKNKFHLKSKIQLKLLNMNRENNRITLGLKQLIEEPWEWAKRELALGQKIKAKVSSMTNFGAFLEIREGLEGLLHLNEMTWDRKKCHPKEYLKLDQEMEVEVFKLDWEARRIALSLRKLLEDPWINIEEKVKSGEIRSGKINGVTKFGVFVHICEGIDGLIHSKDYAWLSSSLDKKNTFKRGQEIQFKVLRVDPKEKRIACGIKQLEESPYAHFKKKYSLGTLLPGKVKRVAPFGLVIALESNLEGTIPLSELNSKGEQKVEDTYKTGDTLEAALQDVDLSKGRIYLSIKASQKRREYEISKQYMQSSQKTAASTPFAELLDKYKIDKA